MSRNDKSGGMSRDSRRAAVEEQRRTEMAKIIRNARVRGPLPEGVEHSCPKCGRHLILNMSLADVLRSKFRCTRCGHRF